MQNLLQKSSSYPVCLNTSATGTGKTLQALATMRALGNKQAFIVVAPLAAHAGWYRWCSAFEKEPIKVINIEKLKTGKTPYLSRKGRGDSARFHWNLPQGSIVIIDEVHKGCAGIQTETGKAVAMLRVQGYPCLMMSATPFQSPLNMQAMGFLLGLHQYDENLFLRWCNANGCEYSKWHKKMVFTNRKENLEKINKQIRDKLVRLTVEDLSDFFGENVVQPELISLETRPLKEMQKVQEQMREEIKAFPENRLVAMLRARQRTELYKAPVMAEMAIDLVAEGHSVFVAVSFKDTVARIKEDLIEAGVPCVSLTGDDNKKHRDFAEKEFNADKALVFISTIEAGGIAISLHHVIEGQRPRASLVTPTFKADTFVQALGRIFRAGGLSPALQKIVLAAGTLEENIHKKLIRKIDNMETLSDSDLEDVD